MESVEHIIELDEVPWKIIAINLVFIGNRRTLYQHSTEINGIHLKLIEESVENQSQFIEQQRRPLNMH